MFFEAATTAATVVRSGCSASVVVRQFVTTYNRKDKIGRLLFLRGWHASPRLGRPKAQAKVSLPCPAVRRAPRRCGVTCTARKHPSTRPSSPDREQEDRVNRCSDEPAADATSEDIGDGVFLAEPASLELEPCSSDACDWRARLNFLARDLMGQGFGASAILH